MKGFGGNLCYRFISARILQFTYQENVDISNVLQPEAERYFEQ